MKILLVGHEASRTGAPVLLAEWGRWLAAHGHSPAFLMARGGPLLGEYASIAPTTVVSSLLLRPGSSVALEVWLRMHYRSFDLAWVNTITIGRLGAALSALMPAITHVHELPHLVDTYVEKAQLAASVATSRHWVAVSRGVSSMLEGLGVPASDIDVVPGIARTIPEASRIEGASRIDGAGRIVGASGTMEWRKGPDTFLHVAQVLRSHPDITFQWMGGNTQGEAFKQMRFDVERAGLRSVSLLGEVSDVESFYRGLGVLLVTSREDPFPLVMLEAAAYGVPVVAFRSGGGAEDFLTDSGGGILVPYLDVDAMAAAVQQILGDDALRTELGERGRRQVLSHHNAEHIFGRMAQALAL